MPWNGGSCSSAVIDDLIYVCGGIVGSATVANLSRLWLDLEAYESQLPLLRWGQRVSFTVEAHPGEVMFIILEDGDDERNPLEMSLALQEFGDKLYVEADRQLTLTECLPPYDASNCALDENINSKVGEEDGAYRRDGRKQPERGSIVFAG